MSACIYEDFLSVILSHKGAAFIAAWLAAHGTEGTTEQINQQPQPQEQSQQKTAGRGRKAGAAPDGQRCIWGHTKSGQCKNSKHEGSEYCKIHAGKAALIGDDAASFVSGQ
jgi:hypothetical protein